MRRIIKREKYYQKVNNDTAGKTNIDPYRIELVASTYCVNGHNRVIVYVLKSNLTYMIVYMFKRFNQIFFIQM